ERVVATSPPLLPRAATSISQVPSSSEVQSSVSRGPKSRIVRKEPPASRARNRYQTSPETPAAFADQVTTVPTGAGPGGAAARLAEPAPPSRSAPSAASVIRKAAIRRALLIRERTFPFRFLLIQAAVDPGMMRHAARPVNRTPVRDSRSGLISPRGDAA